MLVRQLKSLITSRIRFLLFKIIYPGFYYLCRIKKIKYNKVVFVEVRNISLSDSMSLLYCNITKDKNLKVNVHSFRDLETSRIIKVFLSLKILYFISDARVIFLSDTAPVLSACNIRHESKIIQVWHGCGAFKKFGYSTGDLLFGDNKENQIKYPGHRNYSLVTVSSQEVVDKFAEAMQIKEDSGIIKPIGVSRTDVFFDETFVNKAFTKLHSLIPMAENKKIILYAPTFRGRVASAEAPDKMDFNILKRFLGDDYIVLVKYHPFIKNRPVIPSNTKNFALDVTDLLSIEDLICISDVCITDYSSLVLEYSLFEKPIIFFAYDIDDYLDWRGFYYEYETFVPGPIVKDNMELINAVKNSTNNFNKTKIVNFKNKYMNACDGHSTDRILKIFNGYIKDREG